MRSSHARDPKEVRAGVPWGAVRIVRETKKPIAVIARDLGVNPGALGNWVSKDRAERGEDGNGRSRKRSVAGWVKKATK